MTKDDDVVVSTQTLIAAGKIDGAALGCYAVALDALLRLNNAVKQARALAMKRGVSEADAYENAINALVELLLESTQGISRVDLHIALVTLVALANDMSEGPEDVDVD